MEKQIEGLTQSVSFSSLFEILLFIGIICGIGFFLWSKGRFSILHKR